MAGLNLTGHAVASIISVSLLIGPVRALGAAQSTDASSIAYTKLIEISADVDTTYDSNVSRSSREFAQTRGLVLADVIVKPSVELKIQKYVGPNLLFLSSSIGYDYYRSNHILDGERLDNHGGATFRVLRCHESLTGGYSEYRSDLTDIGVITVKNKESHESASFELSCGRSFGISPFLTASQSWEQNSALERQSLNSTTFSTSSGLAYARPALGQLSMFGSYSSTNYPAVAPNGLGPPKANGYQVYSGGLKLDRHLGARIQGVAAISYSDLVSTFGKSGFSGLTYSGDVTFRASSRLSAHTQYARATTPSNIIGASYSIDDTVLGEVSYNIGPRLVMTLGASRVSKKYSVSPAANATFSNETDLSGYGSFAYKMNQHLSLMLELREEQRDANAVGLSYGESQVGLKATGTF